MTMAADARALLMPLLGGDRQASRSELQKLILYARGKDRIEVEDVAAVVANASALALDGAIDAAFAGRPREFEAEFTKLIAAGTSPNAIISAALRQLFELHKLRLRAEAGGGDAMESWRGNFRRKEIVAAGLRIWPAARLTDLMTQLGKIALDVRIHAALAEPIAHRALMGIAQTAAGVNRSGGVRR
jgi:DNA polymerase-3 subunit delta